MLCSTGTPRPAFSPPPFCPLLPSPVLLLLLPLHTFFRPHCSLQPWQPPLTSASSPDVLRPSPGWESAVTATLTKRECTPKCAGKATSICSWLRPARLAAGEAGCSRALRRAAPRAQGPGWPRSPWEWPKGGLPAGIRFSSGLQGEHTSASSSYNASEAGGRGEVGPWGVSRFDLQERGNSSWPH